MKLRCLLLLCAAFAPAWAADAREGEIRLALDHLARAMVNADGAALDRLYAPQLLYSHSDGRLETKAQAVNAVVDKTSVYGAVDYGDNFRFEFYGQTAVARGDTTVKLLGSNPRTLKLNILYVWVKEKKEWRLVARQSTRIP